VQQATKPQIYCDTDTLWNNIERHAAEDIKSARELSSLEKLIAENKSGHCVLLRSRVALRELDRTKNQVHRNKLRADYESLEKIPNDERLCGFHTNFDQFGGFITNPIISDIQDDNLYRRLRERGLATNDAEHLTQAICNRCDIFLTRDEQTIIGPHRGWLESQFPPLKIRLPSELVAELTRS
jgi:hypothetical protein